MPLEVCEVNPKMPILIESTCPENERGPLYLIEGKKVPLLSCPLRISHGLNPAGGHDVQRIDEQPLTIRSTLVKTCRTLSAGPVSNTELDGVLDALRPRVAGPARDRYAALARRVGWRDKKELKCEVTERLPTPRHEHQRRYGHKGCEYLARVGGPASTARAALAFR
jgi:hypothetical protein